MNVNGDSTPLQDVATQVHELFMAYVNAGFSREEALHLVITQIMNAQNYGK